MTKLFWHCERERRFVSDWADLRLVVEPPLLDRSVHFLVLRRLGGLLSSGYRNTVADAMQAPGIIAFRITRTVPPRLMA